jgi:BatD DUF11 like domain/TPR repeat/Bacterial SH3 domain
MVAVLASSVRKFHAGTIGIAALAALLFVSLALPGMSLAELGCRAEVNRDRVAPGEVVILTITAEGDVDWSADFDLPPISGVQLSGGGTNQSMSLVNGHRSFSVVKTFYLRVDQQEDFTIDPVTIRSSGQECQTDPIEIRVSPDAARATVPPAHSGNRTQRPAQSPNTQSARPAGASAAGKPGDEVFVTLDADRTDVWVGQQVLLRFRYYRRIQPWNNPKYVAPRTEGFWREDLGPETNFREMVSGRAYNVTEIRYAIFPAHGGSLTVGPAELQFPDDVFDRFFSSRRRQGPQFLRTDPVVIEVKELPSPAPDGYSGLVATRMDLTAEVDRDSVPRGEPIGLRVQLESDGFLKGFKGLTVPEPDGTRLHDAGEQFASGPRNSRLLGSMVVEKVIVPSRDGILELPPVELSWFDANRGRYRTARSAAHTLAVTHSDLPSADDDDSGFLRNEIARLGQDLAFIHRGGEKLRMRSRPLAGSVPWWGGILFPVALLLGWRLYLARLSADRRDPTGRRQRRALATARKGLKLVAADGPQAEQLDALARIVTRFVADWIGCPPAAVGTGEILDFCAAVSAPEAGESLVRLLQEADQVRYGGGASLSTEDVSREVESTLSHLHAQYRSRAQRRSRSGATTAAVTLLACLAWSFQASATFAQTTTPGIDPARLMAEGNQAYTEGNLEQALSRYSQALEQGSDDADLHFNIGNTYARRGELGKAVVSYLRAERLDPRNADTARNLAWVRGHIQDLELNSGELPLFIDQSAALIGSFTVDEWSLVLLVLVWVLAALLGWAWYREDFGTHLRRILLGLAGLVLIVGVVTGWRFQREQIRREAVIIVVEADVRSGPADSFPVLFQVHDGLTLAIESEREDWVRIGLGGDWVGWIQSGSLEEVRSTALSDGTPGAQGR